jgi:hypothetical protein
MKTIKSDSTEETMTRNEWIVLAIVVAILAVCVVSLVVGVTVGESIIGVILGLVFIGLMVKYIQSEVNTTALANVLTTFLPIAVVCLLVWGFVWYFFTPHPHPRKIVHLKHEYIEAVDGVTADGWLTECVTGDRRHIVGDYTVVDDPTPVVCATESHYQEWIKIQQAQQAQQGGVK